MERVKGIEPSSLKKSQSANHQLLTMFFLSAFKFRLRDSTIRLEIHCVSSVPANVGGEC